MSFKKDFVWGTATAAYQIEGAAYEDGKGANIWDDFCKEKGRIFDASNGDVACDHYHRYKEDIALMSQLGTKAYRFSISWARVMPMGTGEVNQKGLDFYLSLVDELLKYNITPYVTLFHWDYPSELMNKGGWLNNESPKWFADYVRVVVSAFGDKVKHYITLNEPQVFIGEAYCDGGHAPGYKLPPSKGILIAHNVLKAHGMAVSVIRELSPDSKIGFAPCVAPPIPFSDEPSEIEAARVRMFDIGNNERDWAWSCSWWSDPIVLGEYPECGLKKYEEFLPKNYKEDMALINQPIDFYAQNIYQGSYVKNTDKGVIELAKKTGYPHTAINWPITPEALYWGPRFAYERYKLPIIISENGMSCTDSISLDGKVHDPDRIDYLHRYIRELKKAAADGVDVDGYFLWSFLDNFEWARGYYDRFGIVYVDYETQQRLPKDSFFWYKDVIIDNGNNL